jgi:hypothetical protein
VLSACSYATDVLGSLFVAVGWFTVYIMFILVFRNDLHQVHEREARDHDYYESNYMSTIKLYYCIAVLLLVAVVRTMAVTSW